MRALSITLEALCRSLHDELKGIGTTTTLGNTRKKSEKMAGLVSFAWLGAALPKRKWALMCKSKG